MTKSSTVEKRETRQNLTNLSEEYDVASLSGDSTNPAIDSDLDFDPDSMKEDSSNDIETTDHDRSINGSARSTKKKEVLPVDEVPERKSSPLAPPPPQRATRGIKRRVGQGDESVLGLGKESIERKRRKVELASEVAELLEGEDDFLEWRNGIGYLPGSTWKFRYNELGLLEMMDGPESNGVTTPAECGSSSEDATNPDVITKPEEDVKLPKMEADSPPVVVVEAKVEDEVEDDEEDAEDEESGDEDEPVNRVPMLRSSSRSSSGWVTRSHNSMASTDESTSLYGRKRKHRVIDGEIVGVMARKDKYGLDLDKNNIVPAFDWEAYLIRECADAAPVSCFPQYNNCTTTGRFSIGDRLEGIDPHHENLFCALSVARVQGHRIQVHFDGFSDRFDFWINANSPFIFPVGWCKNNGKALQPPKGCTVQDFSWDKYMNKIGAHPANRSLFITPWDLPSPSLHGFCVGMKLEAVDKRNPQMTCVATVADTLDHHVLIHFDDWDNGFDLWAHVNSPLLRPVGYCEEKEKILSLPSTWMDRLSSFSWEGYLKETGASSVPNHIFNPRPPVGFQVGMKLEAVDRRCSQLIRVASVVNVDRVGSEGSGMVTIGYDGWSDRYNVELEEDSADLYPVGHCFSSGHPLQPPPSMHVHLITDQGTTCPTPGCTGYGHVKGPQYTTHNKLSGCPYSERNMKKDFRLYERFDDPLNATSALIPGPGRKRGPSLPPTSIDGVTVGPLDSCGLTATVERIQNISDESNMTALEVTVEPHAGDAVEGEHTLPQRLTSPHITYPSPGSFLAPSSQFLRRKRGRPRKGDLVTHRARYRPFHIQSRPVSHGLNRPTLKSSEVLHKLGSPSGHKSSLSSPQPPTSLVHSPAASALRSVFHPIPPSPDMPPSRTPYWPGLEERRLVHSGLLWKLMPQVIMGASSSTSPRDKPSDEESRVEMWNPEKVSQFVSKIPGCHQIAQAFIDNEIDGQALYYLEQYDLMRIFHLRLGPAVKLASAITGLRYRFPSHDYLPHRFPPQPHHSHHHSASPPPQNGRTSTSPLKGTPVTYST